MDNNEILKPILTTLNQILVSINDLREDIRENRRKIEKVEEKLTAKIEEVDKKLTEEIKRVDTKLTAHITESQRNIKDIKKALSSYESVTDRQYKENKIRIDELEKRFSMVSA